MKIKELPVLNRPREMAMMFGIDALSDAELLALFIGSGYKGVSALDIARDLLKKYGSLYEISRLSHNELKAFKGINKVKALLIVSCFETTKRIMVAQSQTDFLKQKYDLEHIFVHYKNVIGARETEILYLLGFKRGRIIKEIELVRGNKSSLFLEPKDIIALLLKNGIEQFVLVHNHPSQNPTPSIEDEVFTKEIAKEAQFFGLKLLSHMVVTQNAFKLIDF